MDNSWYIAVINELASPLYKENNEEEQRFTRKSYGCFTSDGLTGLAAMFYGFVRLEKGFFVLDPARYGSRLSNGCE